MPLLTYDCDQDAFVANSGYRTPLTGYTARKGSNPQWTVQFISGGVQVARPAGTQFTLGFKQVGQYNSTTYMAYAGPTAWSGPDANLNYYVQIGFNGSALAALFSTNTPSINLIAELERVEPGSLYFFSQPLSVTIQDNVNQGGEGAVSITSPTYYTAAQADLGFIKNWTWVTDIGGNGTYSLNSQPTLNTISVGTIVAMVGMSAINGSNFTMWQFQARTDASDGVTKQRPIDYNASTNANCWIKLF